MNTIMVFTFFLFTITTALLPPINFALQNKTEFAATITAKGGDEIIITDITGRKIKEYKISTNQLKINTDEYGNGIYFLTLYSGLRLVATEKLCVAK